ncbi:MAG: flagellar filament capping protein FliD [Acidobacteriota bacterium]|nr:flagellar filament capping protein FliD [Acidobacteriota bacterium]
MSTTAATFNGSSTYAADLKQVITQAVTVASIPLNQLNSNVTTLQNQSTEVGYLQNGFNLIQTAIKKLTTAVSGGSFSATVGDNTIATANLNTSAAATAGTYTLNVINTGSPTTGVSNASLPAVSDPSASSISTSGTYTLSVNGSNFSISPTTNSLNALAQAINSSGAGVSATVLNLGSPSAPNYQLSLQSTALGNIPIQLNDGSQDLLSTLSTGTQAQYQVNGQPSTPISSDNSTVTLAPGLTVNLLGTGQTTVTVADDSTTAASAISSFVTAYNQTVDELATNRGTAGGALTGQSIAFSLQQALQDMTNYSGGSGSVTSIADLGLTFDGTGHLAFNQSQFSSVAAADPGDLSAFLGTGTGSGFLASVSNTLSGLNDSTNGLFTTQQATIENRILADNQEISDTQARITTMQNQLTARMSAADALLATLQSQNTFMLQLFQAQNAIANQGS